MSTSATRTHDSVQFAVAELHAIEEQRQREAAEAQQRREAEVLAEKRRREQEAQRTRAAEAQRVVDQQRLRIETLREHRQHAEAEVRREQAAERRAADNAKAIEAEVAVLRLHLADRNRGANRWRAFAAALVVLMIAGFATCWSTAVSGGRRCKSCALT